MYKVIVAHPHQQHSFQLATALENEGKLYRYITTVYNKQGSFTEKLIPYLRGANKEKAVRRVCKDLPDQKVVQIGEIFGLFYLLLMRLCKNDKRIMNPYNRLVGRYFGWRVANYAIKHDVNAVIGYDSECGYMFEVLKKKAPSIVRIMDVSAANKLYMKEIYEKDMKISPDFAGRLKKEQCDLFSRNSKKILYQIKEEIDCTQYFLVPSTFVMKSLAYSGVKKEQMLLCPYGVNTRKFSAVSEKKRNRDKSLNVIYVGGVKELKGISYLLKAFQQISPDIAKLTIVGAVNLQDEDIRPYLSNVKFTGTVIHEKVPELLQESDVFVFPSLGEGFALSALEAAACGLPLIISENSGVNDAMTQGIQGFIIPIESVEEIKNKVLWFYENKEKIKEMGEAAQLMAREYTWDKYYQNVVMTLDNILDMGE